MSQDMFERELTRRAEDVHGAPLSFDDVRGKAVSIKRRRRAAVAGGVAAAVALVVLVPTLLTGGDTTRSEIDPAPAPVPTPKADGTFPLTLDGPTGTSPGVSYLNFPDRLLETPDGTIELPDDYDQVLPYDGGWIARLGQDGYVLDADLEVVRTFRAAMGFALSDDGERVAWSEVEGGDSTIVSATTSTPTDETQIEVPGEIQPVGFLADGSVAFRNETDFSAGIASPDGDVQAIDVDYIEDTAPATGLLAVQTAYLDGGLGQSCSGMLSPPADVLWEECGWKLDRVSPDGSLVVAYPSPYEGPSPDGLAVLDTVDGSVVVEYSGLMVDQVVWEDGGSLLATATDESQQAILRLGLDGTVERATDPVDVAPMTVSLWFMSYPRR